MKGIYILYEKSEIVYVGKSSTNMMRRVKQHSEDKIFNRVVLHRIESQSDIALIEIYLIALHKPKYNRESKFVDELTIKIDVSRFLLSGIELEYRAFKYRPTVIELSHEEIDSVVNMIDELIRDDVSMSDIVIMINDIS